MRDRSNVRESVIETHFVDAVEDLGGIAPKYKSPGRKHAPDRLALLPYNLHCFVELKKRGEEPNDGQLREHNRLRALGHRVDVLDSYEAIGRWHDEMRLLIAQAARRFDERSAARVAARCV